MRAKVAKNAGGHALEKRFLDLSELQIALLYRQAVKEEDDADKKIFEVIKIVNEAWSKKFEHLFDMQNLFTNPKIYKRKKELEEFEDHEKEIHEDNFLDEWEKLMEVIPSEYIVEESTSAPAYLEAEDPEFDEVMAGWIETSRKFAKE